MAIRHNKDRTGLKVILKRCSKGNRLAQEHLFKRYYSYAMSIALRYAGSKFEAEEIINDSFYKVFTKLDLHHTDKSFKAWFRKIIINTALDHYRANLRNNQLVVVENVPEIRYDNISFEQIEAEKIIEALQSLSPKYRLVFNLYIIEGYSHEEIADKTGISVSTSRSNLFRAKEKIRELLKQYSYEEKAR